MRPATLATISLLTALSFPGAVAQVQPRVDSTARLIIALRPADPTITASTRLQVQSGIDRVGSVSRRNGLLLRGARDIGGGVVALALEAPLTGSAVEQTLATLRADPDVEFAEVDQRRYAQALPSDPLYTSQWYLQGTEISATNFETAWDLTTGAPDTVVAVLDTGIRYEHPDLDGRLLPGYDFVSRDTPSSFATANDGNHWDPDPSDPGDWLSDEDLASNAFADCDQEFASPSSWHGTRVAAMIAAETNNGAGVAGGTWNGWLLPVRVLGKCGGYDSDIVAGMRWAAGLPVTGVPANANPAQILNVSLGGPGTCSATYRRVMSDMESAGVLVVISAGNASGSVHTPANCAGALAVAGLRHVGTKVGYSSFGSQVGISAPAGNCPEFTPCTYSLITATNTGTQGPVASTYTDTFNANIGTSFSAPIVSALAALMHGVNSQLNPAEFIGRIKASARPFPPPEVGLPVCPALDSATKQCNCTTTTCGAGIADAPGAVSQALRPVARIVAPDVTAAGSNVTVNGSSSAAARGRTISAWAWTSVGGNTQFIGAVDGPTTMVAMPASGPVTVRLTVTDDLGRTDVLNETLIARTSGGGGGGAGHPLQLVVLGLLALTRWRRGRWQRGRARRMAFQR